jgi:TonB family protein
LGSRDDSDFSGGDFASIHDRKSYDQDSFGGAISLSRFRSAVAAGVFIFIIATVQFASATLGKIGDPATLTICDPGTYQNCHEVEGVVPPKLRHAEDSEYPSEARRLRIEGISVVKLVVDENGRPQNVRTFKSITEKLPDSEHQVGLKMDECAVKAVQKFRFKPATRNGHAVAVEIVVMQNYHLD